MQTRVENNGSAGGLQMIKFPIPWKQYVATAIEKNSVHGYIYVILNRNKKSQDGTTVQNTVIKQSKATR